jgi:photosystem II stability/assembly factor-like uncharacterized protein
MIMRQYLFFLCTCLIFTSQSLAQWTKVEEISSPYIYSALFDGDNIFVGGDSLYISKNRGLTWQASAPTGQPIEITAISKFGDVIYLGTYSSGVYISSNNGDSWSPFNSGLGAYAEYAKKFVSSGDTIIYATDGGGVYILKPGSNIWQEYNENLPSNIAWTTNDIVVSNTNIILSSGASGFYHIRPKGSSQWIEGWIQTPNGTYTTPKALLAIGNIVFSGSRAGIYKSLDNGVTWDSVGIRAMPLEAVCFAMDKNRIYAGYTRSSGNDYFVWYTDDLGESWNILDHQFQFLLNLYIYDNKIWAGTNDGFWYKELETTSSDPIEKPITFKLGQNYPNPFNPTTNISWQSPVGSHQTLKVYDVLGNEVAALVNEYREAGNYETFFKADDLASGVYFYRIVIHSDKLQIGSYIETKKMLLLR